MMTDEKENVATQPVWPTGGTVVSNAVTFGKASLHYDGGDLEKENELLRAELEIASNFKLKIIAALGCSAGVPDQMIITEFQRLKHLATKAQELRRELASFVQI